MGDVEDEPSAEDEAEQEEPDASRVGFDRWRTESALGSLTTGVARGLKNVFAPDVDQPVMVAAVPGEPPDAADRVRVILDLDDPSKSVAIVPDDPPPTPD